MANYSMPNQWIVDIAARVMGLLLTDHDVSASVRPDVETVPPQELPSVVSAVIISEDVPDQHAYRISVRSPSQTGSDAEAEARRIVTQFLSRRGHRE
jgi:hypothetical protein